MKLKVDIDEDVYNKAYLKFLDDERRYQIFKGGGSAGKSVFIAQKLITKIMELPGYNVMVIRKVNADNHDSTFAQLTQIINDWNVDSLFQVNKSIGQESITCVNGNKIIFKGCDNIEKRKGTTFETGPLSVIWIEEATDLSESDFKQLRIRLRGQSKVKKYFIISFNPISEDHWLKAVFFDNKVVDEDGYICETTYRDNEFLTENDVKDLESFKDQDYYYYSVYVLNQWGHISTARVFHNIEIHDFDENEDTLENVCYGQDYGFNHANTLMSIGFKDDEIYVFDEIYCKRKTNPEFITLVGARKFDPSSTVSGDSASPDKIKEWVQAGYNVVAAEKGKGSLKAGIDWLKSRKIHIHKTKCPNAAREFPKYKYRELKDGTILDDFLEIDDDCIAACLVGDTIVNTADGDFAIKDLVGKTGIVKSFNGIRGCLRKFNGVSLTKKSAAIFRILLWNGDIIDATPEHPILTKRGWIRTSDLEKTDRVVKINHNNYEYTGIYCVTIKEKLEDVYNMEVEDTHCFSVNGGYIVHNCRYATEHIWKNTKARLRWI